MLKKILVVGILGVTFTCCTTVGASAELSLNQSGYMLSKRPQKSKVVLKNSAWELQRWEYQGSRVILVPKTQLSVKFQDTQVEGSSGCNSFNGSYRLVNNKLSIGTLSSTRMACETDVMNQEFRFLSALKSVRRLRVEGSSRLLLFYRLDGVEGVLDFVSQQ
ncbi:META domain-containing protein [Calothrix sp. 336/3]|uniref:META domain-containing protein n=1 Tax=Calothrix sp. 336/3 TaxID=1337936 RepID=UPI0004E39453|nr:META domain-containing protein [Calothrix sp. 336/3]AKG20426.1 hypothetical protein IJ00_03015 [Calothrix sp. 336/3]